MGTQLPLPQRGTALYFQPISVVDEWLDELRCHLALGMEVGLGPGDFVLDGDPALPPQKGQSPLPNFRPMSIVAKQLDGSRWHLAWRWTLVQATLCWMGPSFRPRKRGQSPQFLAHFCCSQTAGCIKMPLGMEVGLSLGDFVLDGEPAPPT